MFEQWTQQQGRRRRSPWPLAVSVGLHAAAIAALALGAGRLGATGDGERPIDVVFLRDAILQAAAPPDAPASPAERRAARERQAMLDRLVQPTVVPDADPAGAAAAARPAGGAAATQPGKPGAPGKGGGAGAGAGEEGGAGPRDAGAAGDADLPVEAGGGVVRPEPIESTEVQPVYPEEARRAGVRGLVILEVSVDEHGKVGAVKVLRGLGHGSDEAWVAAVRQWRFRPATRYGKPIKVRHILQILSPAAP